MKRSMSKEEFLALYQRQQSSGLTIKDFCDNESYPASCFHYWKKKYGLSHPYTKHTEPTGDSFIPLNINHKMCIRDRYSMLVYEKEQRENILSRLKAKPYQVFYKPPLITVVHLSLIHI